jgi:hypothetical protein
MPIARFYLGRGRGIEGSCPRPQGEIILGKDLMVI